MDRLVTIDTTGRVGMRWIKVELIHRSMWVASGGECYGSMNFVYLHVVVQ
ncbi:MAG: hypothetical protein MUD03_17940 [Pirellula sp.]|nr:hypothetical protein [Pirellula sp.]